MRRIARFFLFFLIAGTLLACSRLASAETPEAAAAGGHEAAASPVVPANKQPSWEYGPFVYYGNGVSNRSDYRFFAAGAQLGRVFSPVVHAGILSGQFELGGNIMPLWQAYTPAPYTEVVPGYGSISYGGGTFRGVSVTPVIFRWNFLTKSGRFQPWFQAAGGVVYTTHKFPPDVLVEHGLPGGTCVWNFTPQGGIGFHYFTRAKRSIDVGVNAVHISSASLGDKNPGVNASIQVQVGYTFWK